MNVDYQHLERDLESGMFRNELEEELLVGFRTLHFSGERLPPASYYAAKMADIVNRGAAEPLAAHMAFNLYQEILAACEAARARVLGEEPPAAGA
jgi:hypothetical protein